ncbi:vacuolar-type H+-ATPase subunit I/STV1 [Bacillus mesophilus]|uniref:RsfA family transcriptional regulator n=1 Tax=Bacillus mesophilus TaxID=1808955 RepID=A0A6M0Q255_9BACI|nr:RsfA family transcriptional regulator [Bacillus mesophilus]MBM7659473.1 vacuolar-type H+-ATPase subunit I/STV1 [Bacillus mesophilus]NEY70346.1 RsfA family transcriptional regulator [Bacillus mesophilus]
MTTVRQDAWTQDEDLFLSEVVLRYIREGGTQLTAFEEVGRKLSRTSAACGFRWNSFVRKQYKQAIELAKKQRKELKKDGALAKTTPADINVTQENNKTDQSLSLSDVIQYLQNYEQTEDEQQSLKKQNQVLQTKLAKLEAENNSLFKEKRDVEHQLELVKEDYKALIGIMDRARKMMMLQDEDEGKVRFQMERNGSLERVE